mgnify:FL=1
MSYLAGDKLVAFRSLDGSHGHSDVDAANSIAASETDVSLFAPIRSPRVLLFFIFYFLHFRFVLSSRRERGGEYLDPPEVSTTIATITGDGDAVIDLRGVAVGGIEDTTGVRLEGQGIQAGREGSR